MSENSAFEKLLNVLKNEEKKTKPKSCGCANKCTVELEFRSEKLKIRSLNIAAGLYLAERSKYILNRRQFMLWAQDCNPEFEDKVKALYDFCDCPNILEYADKYPKWKNAVKKVREDMEDALKRKPDIRVIVNEDDDDDYSWPINPDDDVGDILSLFLDHYDWPANIYFEGVKLKPGKTVAEYNIVEGSVLAIISKELEDTYGKLQGVDDPIFIRHGFLNKITAKNAEKFKTRNIRKEKFKTRNIMSFDTIMLLIFFIGFVFCCLFHRFYKEKW